MSPRTAPAMSSPRRRKRRTLRPLSSMALGRLNGLGQGVLGRLNRSTQDSGSEPASASRLPRRCRRFPALRVPSLIAREGEAKVLRVHAIEASGVDSRPGSFPRPLRRAQWRLAPPTLHWPDLKRMGVPNLSLNWTATLVGCSAWLASLTGTAPANPLRGRGVQLAR